MRKKAAISVLSDVMKEILSFLSNTLESLNMKCFVTLNCIEVDMSGIQEGSY